MKLTKRDIAKIEALRNGETIKMNPGLLNKLRDNLTPKEFGKLFFLAGHCYMEK